MREKRRKAKCDVCWTNKATKIVAFKKQFRDPTYHWVCGECAITDSIVNGESYYNSIGIEISEATIAGSIEKLLNGD